jgi:hypothetical protein
MILKQPSGTGETHIALGAMVYSGAPLRFAPFGSVAWSVRVQGASTTIDLYACSLTTVLTQNQ